MARQPCMSVPCKQARGAQDMSTLLPAAKDALLVLVQPHHDVREVVQLRGLAQRRPRLLRHQRLAAAALGVLACA